MINHPEMRADETFTAANMRAATDHARKGMAQQAYAEVRKSIVVAADEGELKVNVDRIRCGIEAELRKRGFTVIEPDDKCPQWTVGWYP